MNRPIETIADSNTKYAVLTDDRAREIVDAFKRIELLAEWISRDSNEMDKVRAYSTDIKNTIGRVIRK